MMKLASAMLSATVFATVGPAPSTIRYWPRKMASSCGVKMRSSDLGSGTETISGRKSDISVFLSKIFNKADKSIYKRQ
jgi:hypothetical protein